MTVGVTVMEEQMPLEKEGFHLLVDSGEILLSCARWRGGLE